MRDIYEAIEQLSALLSFRIENVARERGWATRPYSWLLAPNPEKLCIVVATTLYLPEGVAASFTPRSSPADGGGVWQIDVKRTDSVVRDSWSDGLSVTRNEKKWVLWCRSVALTDQALAVILDDLGHL